MNAFNRLAMIVILIGSIIIEMVLILALLFARQPLSNIFTNSGRLIGTPTPSGLPPEIALELIVVLIIFFVPSVVLLFLELRRTTRDAIRIHQVSGSDAQLSTQAVGHSLSYYIDALPGVLRVKPRLTTNGKTVDVRLDVETTPDIDVRAKTEEISRTAHNVVEEKLGLKFSQPPRIYIHHAPYPRGTTTQSKPPMPPTPSLLDKPTILTPPANTPPSQPNPQ